MKSELTQKKLKELLHYDPETGIFTWKVRAANRIRSGDVSGHKNKKSYIVIGIDGKSYKAHRLAWLYVYGYFPKNDTDHIDRIKHHNWIKNLRDASRACNLRNCGNRKNNTSGIKGVCWDKKMEKWMARIAINGKDKHLGRYKDFDDAVCARLAGEQYLNWSNCDSSSPAFEYVKKNILANF